MSCEMCKQDFTDIYSERYTHHLMPCDHYICHECIAKARHESNNAPVCPICQTKIEAETC